jgi:hypothetical protein
VFVDATLTAEGPSSDPSAAQKAALEKVADLFDGVTSVKSGWSPVRGKPMPQRYHSVRASRQQRRRLSPSPRATWAASPTVIKNWAKQV